MTGGRLGAYRSRVMGRRFLIGVLAVAACAIFPAPSLASPHSGSTAPKDKFGRGTSTNWSGYDATGTGATHVIGTWTQQAAACGRRESSWSSPWVGIDGDTSSTVEQIGTDTDCSRGTPYYYAWYEMYPKSLVTISMPVRPGDSFTGEVTATSATSFVLRLVNNTTGSSFQTSQTSSNAARSSVEWIMEGPSNSLLTNFGTLGFGGNSATINGQTADLGSLSNVQPITMVGKKGATRANPSAINGGSFSVTWQHG
jgi:Peptidase A4 family